MTWELLASGFGLVEGPTIDVDGTLVFGDVLGGGVHRLHGDGTVSTVVPKRRGVGGIAVHADGGLVIGGRDVQWIRDGHSAVVLGQPHVPGVNDLGADAAGRLYVGSVRWNSLDPDAPHVPGELWRVDLDGTPTALYGDVQQCNGVAVSPDGSFICHSDTRAHGVIVHDLHDGEVSNRRLWSTGERSRPDGIAFDETGALWMADHGGTRVVRLRPDGAIDSELEVPCRHVTSVCFDGSMLVVVSADNALEPERKGSIFRTDVGVAGAPVPPVRVRPAA